MSLAGWIAKKQEELRSQQPVQLRDLTPSIRDFAHAITTHREAIAVIGGLRGGAVRELSRAFDERGVSAIATATDAWLGGALADLGASAAAGLPLLREELVLSASQIHEARLHGADAVLLKVAALGTELKKLVDATMTLHMTAAVEVASEDELAAATAAGARVVVLSCEEQPLERAVALAALVPKRTATVLRGAIPLEVLPALRGKLDAVWLVGPLLAPERLDALAAFVESAESG